MLVRMVCVVLVLAFCGSVLGRDPEQMSRWVEQAKVRAVKMRGLSFLQDVPVETMTRAQIEAEILEVVERDMPPEWRVRVDRGYKAFGLVPMDSDVINDMIRLVVSQAGGFYDPVAKHVILPDDLEEFMGQMVGEMVAGAPGFMDPMMRNILTHEFTHALQDQHHDLSGIMDVGMDDDDVQLAITALVEGDATLIGTGAMMNDAGDLTNLLRQDPTAMAAMMGAGGGMLGAEANAMPAILKETLIFPYVHGYILVTKMVQEGGFERVDRAFADPPLSSEQLLYPQKYLGEVRDEPVEVTLPEFDVLGAGWSLVGRNTLGEFQTRILLGNTPDAIAAAQGWGGDRYAVYEHDDGRLGVVWVSVWDDAGEAKQFFEEIAYHEGKRFEGEASRARYREAGGVSFAVVGTEQDTSHVSLVGDMVVLARGFGPGLAGELDTLAREGSTRRVKTWADIRAKQAKPELVAP
ncbi:MAG: hypothetical protein KIT54_06605 [Phycisphaeraceae bacterium]|nr:hypothetical protein [Phycisphaeraceae bacterium]